MFVLSALPSVSVCVCPSLCVCLCLCASWVCMILFACLSRSRAQMEGGSQTARRTGWVCVCKRGKGGGRGVARDNVGHSHVRSDG